MIKLNLTEAEAGAMAGLLDAAVKSLGLRAIRDAAGLMDKLEQAVQAAKDEQNGDSDNHR